MLMTRMDSFPRAVEIATDGTTTENNFKSLPLLNFPEVRVLVDKQLPASNIACGLRWGVIPPLKTLSYLSGLFFGALCLDVRSSSGLSRGADGRQEDGWQDAGGRGRLYPSRVA
jgi:hypothetical protein